MIVRFQWICGYDVVKLKLQMQQNKIQGVDTWTYMNC